MDWNLSYILCSPRGKLLYLHHFLVKRRRQEEDRKGAPKQNQYQGDQYHHTFMSSCIVTPPARFHEKRKLIKVTSETIMEVDAVVTTVLRGRTGDNNGLSQKLTEQISKLAAKVKGGGSKKTIFERVVHAKACFDWGDLKPLFDAAAKQFHKSSEVSARLQGKGNDFYKQQNLDAALRAYSLAVAFAPCGSEQLCSAYVSRSGVLLQKGLPAEALNDTQRGLKDGINCPDGLRKTLEERRLQCEAMVSMQNVMKKPVSQGKRELNEMLDKLFEIQEPNPAIPNAESFVKMAFTPEKGRHLIVTQSVKAGTVLMVDKPFVSVLNKLLKFEVGHCHNCSVPIVAGIPCSTCTFAMFCCDNCKERACDDENGIHRYEHNYLPILNALKAPYGEIQSLRILAQIGPNELQRMWRQPKLFTDGNRENVMGYNEQGIYDVYTYLPTFRLIAHECQPEKGVDGSTMGVRKALKAIFLKEIIKEYSNYFHDMDLSPSERESLEDFAAALLLRHLENIKYNAFSLSEQVGEKQTKSVSYAAALFPLLSLCNHSCDPNCAPVKQSEHLITSLIALKSLKEGDELFITYKPLYTFMKTSERQKYLADNYLFECKCQPCEENWGPANVQVNGNQHDPSIILETSRCESCDTPENSKRKQCPRCAAKDVTKAKGIQKLGGILFECHDYIEQEKWTKCLQRLPKIVDYFGRNGFNSYFPLYHVALDLYKRALMSSVAQL